jgi:hypothetical protein
MICVALLAAMFLIRGWSSHRATYTTSDELCGVRQAIAFEHGRATLPLDFFGAHIDPSSVCFARSPNGFFAIQGPGWPAVLAAASVVGIPQERVPWLIAISTLFLVGISGVLMGGLPLAIALMVSLQHNQFFDDISRSYWSHSLSMLCVALIMMSVISAQGASQERARIVCFLSAGIATGLLLLTRPLVGLSALASVGMWGLFLLRGKGRGFAWKVALAFLVGPLCGATLYGLFNHFTTGSFFLSGYEYSFGVGHNPGFFRVSPNGVVHTPARAWMLLRHHVGHVLLFVVPSALYFLVAVVFGVGMAWSRSLVFALWMTLCLWLGAATYWDSSYFVGPRFYYESLVPLTMVVFGALWNSIRLLSGAARLGKEAAWIETLLFLGLVLALLPEPPVR